MLTSFNIVNSNFCCSSETFCYFWTLEFHVSYKFSGCSGLTQSSFCSLLNKSSRLFSKWHWPLHKRSAFCLLYPRWHSWVVAAFAHNIMRTANITEPESRISLKVCAWPPEVQLIGSCALLVFFPDFHNFAARQGSVISSTMLCGLWML